MPLPEIGQKDEKTWMNECVSVMVAEGKDQEQAVAICSNAFKTKQTEVTPLPGQPEKPKIKSKIEILAEIKKLAEKNNLSIEDEKLMSLFSDMMEKKDASSLSIKFAVNPLPNGVEVQIFPRGKLFIEKYDKWIIFDTVLFSDMIRAFQSDKLFKPFFDNEHKLGEKFGDILELYEKPEGLFARVDFNDMGKQAIMDRKYSYISPEFGTRKDLDGIPHANALWAVTLTNIPAFEGKIKPLQEQVKFSKLPDIGGRNMTVKETLAKFEGRITALKFANEPTGQPSGDMNGMLTELVDTLKTWAAKIEELTMGKEQAEAKVEEVEASLSKIQKEKDEKEKDEFFETAVKQGQLEIGELEFCKNLYDVSKDNVKSMILARPVKDSGQISLTKQPTNTNLSADDYEIMKKQGFHRDDGTFDIVRYERDVLGR